MFESNLKQVAEKYKAQIEALEVQLEEQGLSVFLQPVLTEEQHQKILFGQYFDGLDKPLKFPF